MLGMTREPEIVERMRGKQGNLKPIDVCIYGERLRRNDYTHLGFAVEKMMI